MKSRFALAALLLTSTLGLALAQTPAPKPAAPPASDAMPVPPPPKVTGTSWVLMDFASGNVLAAEMAGGKIKPDDQVMMSENAWRTGGAGTDGSYSGFEVNKTAPLEAMEKGMAVQSGNDAAIALAEHVAGSEDAFAALMNAYAKRIGMKNTHFVNATGLSAQGHYSTARDLALHGPAVVPQ
jgi:D-alanyl-D-alanine carboxypeptidase (penicillin-binding protein 5/6)